MIAPTKAAYLYVLNFFVHEAGERRVQFLRAWRDGLFAQIKDDWPLAHQSVYALTKVLNDSSERSAEERAFSEVVDFACDPTTEHPRDFVAAWFWGEFEICRKNWPQAPKEIYFNDATNEAQTEIIAYHGSGCSIELFDYAFTSIGNDQNGSGFYFTSSLEEAIAYTKNRIEDDLVKPGGESSPTVHVATLRFLRLLDCREALSISAAQVRQILTYAPDLDDRLQDWGEVDYEGRALVLSRAINSYKHKRSDGPVIKTLFKISNDFFGRDTRAFNEAVRDVLGIDGVMERHEDKIHYVAFFPDQIRMLERLTRDEALERLQAQESQADLGNETKGSRPRG